MGILINPLDTVFFKDGKPFSMGAETWADGIFPPSPGTILGAVRTLILSSTENGYASANTESDPTSNLRITGLGYYVANAIHFPLPLDCVRAKDTEPKFANRVFTIQRKLKKENTGSYPFKYLLLPENSQKVESLADGLIPAESLQNYLTTGKVDTYCERMGEFLTREPKTGIGRANLTRTTAEGKLYRVGLLRLESTKLRGKNTKTLKIAVNFNQDMLTGSSLARVGAESKIFEISQTEFPEIKKMTSCPDEKNLKLYLATPAIFNEGSLPSFTEHEILKKFTITVQAAVTGKPLQIGGFDMKMKRPKEMMRAVPAGSVYYIQCEEGYRALADAIHGASISDQRVNEGFGIVYLGVQANA